LAFVWLRTWGFVVLDLPLCRLALLSNVGNWTIKVLSSTDTCFGTLIFPFKREYKLYSLHLSFHIWVYMIRGSSLLNWLVWSRLSIRKKGLCKFGRISNDVFMECPSSHYPVPSNLMPKTLQIWQFDQNFACKVVHKRGYFLRIRVTTFLLLFPAYICYLYIFFLFPSHYPFF